MAITYGFYNSMNGDRKYDAAQLSSIFDGVIRDGVFQSIGGYLATKPGTGMQVIVSPGKAWFDHTWTVNDADLPLGISPSDLTLSRYDAVVLETDATKAVRENSIKVIKGTPASDPKKPTLTNEGDVHQHPLAYILVPGGSTEIQVQNIDIMVGKTECPFVTSILESISIEALLKKWEGEFRVWFDELQNQMAGDVATNLQNQITKNAGVIGDISVSYSNSKQSVWLPCNGYAYDEGKYSELRSLLLSACSYNKKAPLIPNVARVIFVGEKAIYFNDDESIMYVADNKWAGPDFERPFNIRERLTGKMPRSPYSMFYANGYYIILAQDPSYNSSTRKYEMKYLYSTDCHSWSEAAVPIGGNQKSALAVYYQNGSYVFVLYSNNYAYVYRASSISPSAVDSGEILIGSAKDFSIYVSEDGQTSYFLGQDSGSTSQNWKLTSSWNVQSFTLPSRSNVTMAGACVVDGKLHVVSYNFPESYNIAIYVGKEGETSHISVSWPFDDSGYECNHAAAVVDNGSLYIFVSNRIYKLSGTKLDLVEQDIPFLTGYESNAYYYSITVKTVATNLNASTLIAEPSKKTLVASCYRGFSSDGLSVTESTCRSNSPYATPFVGSDQAKAYIRGKN